MCTSPPNAHRTEQYMSHQGFDTSVLGEFFWNSTELLSVLGSDGSWQIVNAAWPEQMGWSLEDLQGGPFIDLIHPDDVEVTIREFERLVTSPDATLVERSEEHTSELQS